MTIRNLQVLIPDNEQESLSGGIDLYKRDEGHFITFQQNNTTISNRLEDFGEDELKLLANFIVDVLDEK